VSNEQPEKIERLIERSSLGSKDARRARARVPLSTGQAVARSAAAGRFVASEPPTKRRRKG
jgi:hypothetical protein